MRRRFLDLPKVTHRMIRKSSLCLQHVCTFSFRTTLPLMLASDLCSYVVPIMWIYHWVDTFSFFFFRLKMSKCAPDLHACRSGCYYPLHVLSNTRGFHNHRRVMNRIFRWVRKIIILFYRRRRRRRPSSLPEQHIHLGVVRVGRRFHTGILFMLPEYVPKP